MKTLGARGLDYGHVYFEKSPNNTTADFLNFILMLKI